MHRLVFHIVALGLALCSTSQANENLSSGIWSHWQNARELYDQGNYTAALQAIQADPTEDSSYYYNLGTLYYRTGKIGMAVAYLEKANRMNPHDISIQHNLKISRESLSKTLGEDQLDPASTWMESIADHLSLDEIRGAFGLLALMLALLWTRSYLKIRDLKKTLFRPAGIFGLVGLSITTALYGAQRLSESHPPAIALEQVVVRSGPGEHFVELGELAAGAKIRVLGPSATSTAVQQGSLHTEVQPNATQSNPELWRQVRFSQDGIGWIRSSSVLLL